MDNNSSCWIRVSQSSADGGFGHMHIPRIGEEVIVDFLDGDPDRPIVTGRVYNSARMPPYTLPDEKTKSTWKSQTVGSSGSYDGAENPPSGNGFNEIRFEDKGGSEEVFIHAQRVMNSWYRLDETRKTGRDTAIRVGRNRQTNIQKNETLTVETGDETRNIQQGSRQTTIQKADTLTLNTGDYSMKVSAGQATFEAMQQITLKVGSNSIVISQQGVTIKALTVSVTADTTLAVKGLTSDLEASTMMTIKGAMVMIN
jgi:type VI secretion system secreted protein VgrG